MILIPKEDYRSLLATQKEFQSIQTKYRSMHKEYQSILPYRNLLHTPLTHNTPNDVYGHQSRLCKLVRESSDALDGTYAELACTLVPPPLTNAPRDTLFKRAIGVPEQATHNEFQERLRMIESVYGAKVSNILSERWLSGWYKWNAGGGGRSGVGLRWERDGGRVESEVVEVMSTSPVEGSSIIPSDEGVGEEVYEGARESVNIDSEDEEVGAGSRDKGKGPELGPTSAPVIPAPPVVDVEMNEAERRREGSVGDFDDLRDDVVGMDVLEDGRRRGDEDVFVRSLLETGEGTGRGEETGIVIDDVGACEGGQQVVDDVPEVRGNTGGKRVVTEVSREVVAEALLEDAVVRANLEASGFRDGDGGVLGEVVETEGSRGREDAVVNVPETEGSRGGEEEVVQNAGQMEGSVDLRGSDSVVDEQVGSSSQQKGKQVLRGPAPTPTVPQPEIPEQTASKKRKHRANSPDRSFANDAGTTSTEPTPKKKPKKKSTKPPPPPLPPSLSYHVLINYIGTGLTASNTTATEALLHELRTRLPTINIDGVDFTTRKHTYSALVTSGRNIQNRINMQRLEACWEPFRFYLYKMRQDGEFTFETVDAEFGNESSKVDTFKRRQSLYADIIDTFGPRGFVLDLYSVLNRLRGPGVRQVAVVFGKAGRPAWPMDGMEDELREVWGAYERCVMPDPGALERLRSKVEMWEREHGGVGVGDEEFVLGGEGWRDGGDGEEGVGGDGGEDGVGLRQGRMLCLGMAVGWRMRVGSQGHQYFEGG
ncbi:hypothetical protein HDV00_012547 [Rhizophlyctis rosea]|nr:hypothetical protein HDV00_012547 [Rhizophlyctis rosea]